MNSRILYITQLDPSHKFGSLEQCILALAETIRQRGGLLVPVFSGPVPADLAARFATAAVPYADGMDLTVWSWSRARRLLALVDRHAVDGVDVSFYGPLNRYVSVLRFLRPKLRLIYTDHRSGLPTPRPGPSWRRAWRNLLLRRYRKILAISDYNLAVLQGDGWPHVERCQLFVDAERFKPDRAIRERVRRELGAGDQFVALVVGQLIVWKGIDTAIRAMAAASTSARLWIVGAGTERAALERLSQDLGLTSRIVFIGEKQDVAPYMQAADCLMCPSRWQEAMGFVNLEAMACGLPVVASRVGGIPELVQHEHNGLLVEAGHVDETAAALRRLIESPDLCQTLGRQGVQRVRTMYSKEACLDRYIAHYDFSHSLN